MPDAAYWPANEKLRIIEDSLVPGESVAEWSEQRPNRAFQTDRQPKPVLLIQRLETGNVQPLILGDDPLLQPGPLPGSPIWPTIAASAADIQ